MIPKVNCITACLCHYKLGILLFLVLNDIGQTYGGLTINFISSNCGREYSLDVRKSAQIEHKGSDILHDDKCNLGFSKSQVYDDQLICVSGQEIKLDCRTQLEYHAGYIKDNRSDAEKSMTCSNATLDKWCAKSYQNTVYIVIRKAADVTSDVIRLEVYLKDAPSHGPRNALIIFGSFVVMSLILVASQVCRRQSRQGHLESKYDADTGAITMQTGERQTDGDDDTIEGGLTENSDLVSMETTVENVMEKCETCDRQTDGNDDETIKGRITENSDIVSMDTTDENVMEKSEPCAHDSTITGHLETITVERQRKGPPQNKIIVPPPAYDVVLNKKQ
ncbi:uncharacterized protein LOC132715907 isoform X2 [Ruditapes philippinarum]|uniref:uncharacterized protein LOC132715907 isoform X2 n=1 Tax=Ruditapes philippinarum TaxID=129788 RepID=UPI00295BBEE4|nr:uncharacterized protein LOC132715907 isoform X2 [Ruditapes philippinarum]